MQRPDNPKCFPQFGFFNAYKAENVEREETKSRAQQFEGPVLLWKTCSGSQAPNLHRHECRTPRKAPLSGEGLQPTVFSGGASGLATSGPGVDGASRRPSAPLCRTHGALHFS